MVIRLPIATALIVLLSLLSLWRTVAHYQSEQALEAAHVREVTAQQAHIALLTQENARLHLALVELARRPERALALAVEADLANELLGLINADRATLGRPILRSDRQLDWVARWRSETMAIQGWYAHVSPTTGESAGSVLAGFGGPNVRVGESIWSCQSWQTCGAPEIHQVFKDSAPHRENQELGLYDHFGLGVAIDPEGRLLVTELFSDQPGVEALSRRPSDP